MLLRNYNDNLGVHSGADPLGCTSIKCGFQRGCPLILFCFQASFGNFVEPNVYNPENFSFTLDLQMSFHI
jgi:hypothetical protein